LCSSTTGSVTSNTKPVSQNENLLIGTGPLPATAPPEKKPATTRPLEVPKAASQAPPPLSSAPAAVVTQPQLAKAAVPTPVPAPVPPPPARPAVTSPAVPKLAQPMPLASRPPLPSIARSVAAAFLEQDDDETETAPVKTSTGVITTSSTALTFLAQNSTVAKKLEPTVTKPPAPVPPPVTTAAATSANKLATATSDFMMGLSGMSFSDMVLAAQMQKTVDIKGVDHTKAWTMNSDRQPYLSKRPKLPRDSRGRTKLEIGRNVM